jgi:hypothetical protein
MNIEDGVGKSIDGEGKANVQEDGEEPDVSLLSSWPPIRSTEKV